MQHRTGAKRSGDKEVQGINRKIAHDSEEHDQGAKGANPNRWQEEKGQPNWAALSSDNRIGYWAAGLRRAGGFLVVVGAALAFSRVPFSITIMNGFGV